MKFLMVINIVYEFTSIWKNKIKYLQTNLLIMQCDRCHSSDVIPINTTPSSVMTHHSLLPGQEPVLQEEYKCNNCGYIGRKWRLIIKFLYYFL